MSQVKVQGNASGTGVFTLAAPNGNTDRTLTLPDSAGTIATSGSTITYPDSSTQASSQVGMQNRIIDGAFILNQRGYVTNTSLSSGTYGHDRWKGGASAGTYTFTQGALGVPTTITITTGSIIQVIEGCNLPEGGTYVLSWTGTAQGSLNGGSYGASGSVTVTGWTAGTNLNVEFNTGTLGSVQLEKGSLATSFDFRSYGQELALCQRYYSQFSVAGLSDYVWAYSPYSPASYTALPNTSASMPMYFPVTMRAVPTVIGTPNTGTINRSTSTTEFVAFQWSATLANNAYAVTAYTANAEL